MKCNKGTRLKILLLGLFLAVLCTFSFMKTCENYNSSIASNSKFNTCEYGQPCIYRDYIPIGGAKHMLDENDDRVQKVGTEIEIEDPNKCFKLCEMNEDCEVAAWGWNSNNARKPTCTKYSFTNGFDPKYIKRNPDTTAKAGKAYLLSTKSNSWANFVGGKTPFKNENWTNMLQNVKTSSK